MNAPCPVSPASIPDAVFALRMEWKRCRTFGLKFTGKLPPLTHEEYEAARREVEEYYYAPGHICGADFRASKQLARAMYAVIEAAREECRASNARPSKMVEIRRMLRERDGDDCWICGHELTGDPTIEHKLALANGGTWAFDNLALAHRECNHSLQRLPLAAKEAVRRTIQKERLAQ